MFHVFELYRLANKVSSSDVEEDWLVELRAQLEKQGLTIPERYYHLVSVFT